MAGRLVRRLGAGAAVAGHPRPPAPRGPPPPGWCTPTCWSWAAASPACGRRCARSSATRACRSCSSRATGSPSTRPVATAASARPASPTARPTGAPAGPTSTTGCTSSACATSTPSRRRSSATGSTAASPAAARSRSPPGRTRSPTSTRTSPGFLDAAAVRALVDSPTYLAGRLEPDGTAVVDPARLAWGLADAAEELGVRLHEHTRVVSARRRGAGVEVTHGPGGHPGRPRRPGHQRLPQPAPAPALVGGPGLRLRAGHRAADRGPARRPAVGPQHRRLRLRQPVPLLPRDARTAGSCGAATTRSTTSGARSPTSTRTAGRPSRPSPATSRETFPQLRGIRFTHRWSGVIDTSTRFCALFGTAHRGRTAYATGFTGLGVGASRFAADVMLDLLDGRGDRAHPPRDGPHGGRCRSRPSRSPGWASRPPAGRWPARTRTGRRNAWLRLLDRLGLGFDS